MNREYLRESLNLCEEGAESGGSPERKMAELPKEKAFGMLGFFYCESMS